jgi:hypothetical protein
MSQEALFFRPQNTFLHITSRSRLFAHAKTKVVVTDAKRLHATLAQDGE